MTNLISPGDSSADNEYLQLAQSHKYDSSLICTIAQLGPSLFALYQHAVPLYVGTSWEELIDAYYNRPVYVNRPARPPHSNEPRHRGKISAADKAANTAKLLARMKGATGDI